MNDPEVTGPKLPWHRRLFARSREGRTLRRRILIVLALVTLPYTAFLVFGADPRKIAASLGLRRMPTVGVWAQPCHHAAECTGMCAFGHPFCQRGGVGSDPQDPLGGSCACRSKEEHMRRLTPPAWCRTPVLRYDDGDQQDWNCSGFDPPDGGDGGKP